MPSNFSSDHLWDRFKSCPSCCSVVGGSGGWVANNMTLLWALHHLGLDLRLLHSWTHSRSHHALAACGLWSRILVLESFLKLDSLNVLLILDFLLDVLVSLKQLVVLCLSELQSLIQIGLKLLLQGVHFILLFLDEFGLGIDDLLLPLLHILLSLLTLQLLAPNLNLVCLLIPILN